MRKKYVVAVVGEERQEGLAAAQAQRELLRLLQCAVDDHRKHNPHQQQVPYGARHRDGEGALEAEQAAETLLVAQPDEHHCLEEDE